MFRLWDNAFVRFLAVGMLNTAFGYSVFAASFWLGFGNTLSALLATIFGVLFNFKTTGVIVFKSRENTLIFSFFGVYALTYIFNLAGLYLLNRAGLDSYAAAAVLALPAALMSFTLNKKLVFRDRHLTNKDETVDGGER